MPNRLQVPVIEKIPIPELLSPREGQLSNGIPLVMLSGGGEPLVQLTLVAQSGGWYAAAPGIASGVAAMLKEGTEGRNAANVACYIEQYGASLRVEATADAITLQLICLAKHLKELVPLLGEILSAPAFAPVAWEQVRQRQQQHIAMQLAENSFLANKAMIEQLYGAQHPYGNTPTDADLAAITVEDLRAYHATQLLTNVSVWLAGDLPADTFALLDRHIGQLVLVAPEPLEYPMQCTPKKIYGASSNPLQASIAWGKLICSPQHPDYSPLRIAVALLGGFFGSYLMQHLREQKGYTYGVAARLCTQLRATHLAVTADVLVDKAEASIAIIEDEMERLRCDPVAPEMLKRLRCYLQGDLLRNLEGPYRQLRQLRYAYLQGLPADDWQKLWTHIQGITPEGIQTMARAYLGNQGCVQVIIGPKSK